MPRVEQTKLQWVHAQRLGQAVHLQFSREVALRAAEAAIRAAGHVVGVDGARVDVDVVAHVWPQAGQRRIAQHLGGSVGVGAAVAGEIDLLRDQLAIPRRTPFCANYRRVALVVTDDRLAPAPDRLDRAVDAALPEPPGGQRQHDLH